MLFQPTVYDRGICLVRFDRGTVGLGSRRVVNSAGSAEVLMKQEALLEFCSREVLRVLGNSVASEAAKSSKWSCATSCGIISNCVDGSFHLHTLKCRGRRGRVCILGDFFSLRCFGSTKHGAHGCFRPSPWKQYRNPRDR